MMTYVPLLIAALISMPGTALAETAQWHAAAKVAGQEHNVIGAAFGPLPSRATAPRQAHDPANCVALTADGKVMSSDGRDAREASDNLLAQIVTYNSPILCTKTNDLGELIPFDTFDDSSFRKGEVIVRLRENSDAGRVVANIDGQGDIRPGKRIGNLLPITQVRNEKELCAKLSRNPAVTGCTGNYVPTR
jgi:hypothetical protein